MNAEIIILVVLVVVVIALVFVSKQWGKAGANADQAQANQEQMRENEKTDNLPDINDPMSDMLCKKDKHLP
jgi:hypothetical protein